METIKLSGIAISTIEGLRERGDYDCIKADIADALATVVELQSNMDEQEVEAWLPSFRNLSRTLAEYNNLINILYSEV